MSVSVAVILDTRREKQNKLYPVKLRVIHERKPEYYPTIYDLSKDDYQKLIAPRISASLQQIRSQLQQVELNAKAFVKDMEPFSFEVFEKEFVHSNPIFRKRKAKKEPITITAELDFDLKPYEKRFSIFKEVHLDEDYISATFANYIKRLLEEGRIGSALNYQDTYGSLKRFSGNVRFANITVSYLNKYERWMVDVNKCSKTTVGIKLRALRAVFNEAIENGLIKRDKCYPFGRRKYQIPTSRNLKKALELTDVQKIYEHVPEAYEARKAKAYWLFCYFGNGMNPKDLAYLRYKNIDGEYLSFIRAKTERSTRNDPKLITAYINEDMTQIIEEWGNKDRRPNNFIFPILNHEADPMRQFVIVKNLVKFINEGMARIAVTLGINKKVNNMVCRHTFSTVMKRSGASTEFIQEALGHTDKKTTENYLDSFEKEVKKEFAGKLVAFKNVS